MGIFNRFFPKKDAHHDHAHDHHDHEHFDCARCGRSFHSAAELESHLKQAHA